MVSPCSVLLKGEVGDALVTHKSLRGQTNYQIRGGKLGVVRPIVFGAEKSVDHCARRGEDDGCRSPSPSPWVQHAPQKHLSMEQKMQP